MKTSRAASRYAKALIDLAIERKELETVKNDVLVAKTAIDSSRDLKLFLASPVVKPKVKQSILNEIFSDHLSELTMHFVLLITRHGREQALPAILNAFMDQYRQHKNIVEATVITSVEVSNKTINTIKERLAEALGKDVDMNTAVDDKLVGGFIVETNNYRMDASIAGSMRKLKRELTK
jgi:F-type H+-transporting ATPase subunit delta